MICTIVIRSELAYARVLATRLAELAAGARLTALVADARERPPDEPGLALLGLRDLFAAVPLELLGCEAEELKQRVAPALVRHALDRHPDDPVVLLGHEVDVHAPLDDVAALAARHGVVLVPRLLRSLPDDGASPSEADVLAGGLYDSGLLAVGPTQSGRRFVDWWQSAALGPEPPGAVRLDLVPVLFPEATVLRDPGHGVAYWNVATRTLEGGPDGVRVDGEKLRTFYFKGFDPQRPHWLNDANTRVRVTENAALTQLCDAYATRLLAAGWARDAAVPFGFGTLPNGLALDRHLRSLLMRARAEDADLGDPFEPAGADRLLRWANGPAPFGAASGVTRYLFEIYLARGDLQQWLPNLDGDDGEHFMEWVRLHGVHEERVPALLASPASPPGQTGRLGVNVAGYLSGGLGLGEAARAYVRALQAVDVAVRTESVDPPLPPDQTLFGVRTARKRLEFGELDEGQDFPLNLVCVNAPEFPGFVRRVGEEFFAGRRTIAVWAWETSFIPPEWDDAFGSIDEIWTYTTYVASVLAQRSPVPVVAIPLPVTAPTAFSELDLGLPDGFTFLFAFDFFSTIQRKNPIGLIQAFTRAFAPGEGPQLVLKSFNGDYKPEHLERVRHAARGRDDITIVDRFLSLEERNALMARADCYVSLHRSEGFGLTLAEAMSLEKPVIATAYSGNLDFMDPSNSFLVDYELTRVGPGVEIYPADGVWAEPDIEHAARLMRHVVEQPGDAAEKARRGRERIERQLSPRACGTLARTRLERLMGEPAGEPAPVPRTPWPGLDRLAAKASFDPLAAARGRDPRVLARRAALEAMRPFTFHQREFNDRAVGALRDLHGQIDERFAQADDRALKLSRRARRAEWQARRLEARVGQLEELLSGAAGLFEAPAVATLERVIEGARARPASAHPLLTEERGAGAPVLAFGDWNRAAAGGYAGFEDIFRGSEEEIRERQRFYLPLLEGHGPVLDVGCGRGELLELLRDAGTPARGVDLDAGMVERCRAKGLEVERADGVSALEAQPERSLGAVVALQVVEHLPYATLIAFLEAARTRLAPGGLLVAETVNPHAPAALKAFWTDPTHQHPLFPEVLLALCRLTGFSGGRVLLPGARGDFDDAIYAARDYAVVASR